jgi:ABC-type sugar transport system substrate-binding protein
MKMLPFMPGSVSTQDQISKGRENVSALLQAHPQPGSITAIISWWWPLSLGAVQALKQANRTDIKVFNHYYSDQFLEEMGRGGTPLDFSTDVPWHTLGKMVGETAMKLGRGEDVKPFNTFIPATYISTPEEAQKAGAEIADMDKQAIAFLKQYGG